MLDYTRGVFSKTIDDLKKLTFLFSLSLQIFQVGYLIYALCIGAGILIANIILLIISSLYLGFVLYVHHFAVAEEMTKLLKSIYRWSKRLIKLFTLAVSIYGLYTTISDPVTVKSLISIVFLMFMAIAWIFDVLFSVLIIIIEQRKELFFNAIKMDLEPVFKAKNFMDKIRGKEVDDEIVTTKDRDKLEKIKSAFRQKKKQEKADKKEERRAMRAAKKAEKQN